MESVIVVAFDGMDRQLIEDWELQNVKQEEFGRIDNRTDITEIKTGELFASFITGETSEVHGVTGVKGWNTPVMDVVERMVPRREPFYSWAAGVKDVFTGVAGFERETFTKEDVPVQTLFDDIPDSLALNVPAYSVNAGIEVFAWVLDRYGIEQAEREARKEFRQRKEEFRDELENDSRDFLMAHFHFLDSMNHLFGDSVEDEDKLKDAYREMDAFAGEIKEEVAGKYDTVIFMSDHGLPTETAHNEQAFYSCNRDLFPGKTPHITDFHDRILDLVEAENLSGVEI